MRLRPTVLFLLSSVLWAASSLLRAAAPVIQSAELAPDLGYLRVQSVVLDRETIATALAKPRALVLDLRHPFDERDAGDTLRKLLEAPASAARLYVLVSPVTPVPVVGAIAAHPARLITLGVKGAKPEPQVVVLQTAEDDNIAYAAILAGTAPAELISGRIEKERFDEASLVKEFKSGNHTPPPVLPVTPATNGSATTAGKGEPPPKPVDRVLQRAVHLHRTLQALKRG